MQERHHSRPEATGSDTGRVTSVFAQALQQAARELRATAAIVVLPVDDGHSLASAVVVGRPLSIFTTIERMPVTARLASATAHRTGRQYVSTFTEFDSAAPSRFDVTMPFPYTVASTPIRSPDVGYGVLTVIWAPPLGPRTLQPDELDRCEKIADDLARELAQSGFAAPPRTALPMPQFLQALPDRVGQEWAPESANITFLYQIYKLASWLNRAVRGQQVLDVVASRIMEPFGARGMAVSVEQDGQATLLGYSGYPRTVAHALAGAPPPSPDDHTPGMNPLSVTAPTFLESERALVAARFDGASQDVRACALLPLISGGLRAGTLALGFDGPRHFSAEERSTLVTMADLVAQAVERAVHFENEHRLARELQQGLLPARLPHREDLDIATRYVTATAGTAVGGDWYDVLTLPDGNVGLVMGDVEGHNPNAAACMGQLRSAVRAYAAEGHRPAALLERTNRILTELDTELFATCCCVWLDLDVGTAEISSAGHPAPLLCHPDHRVVVPEMSVGLPLGVAPDTVYQSMEQPLPDGTLLALYTDGLVHSRTVDLGNAGEVLGETLAATGDERLEDLATRVIESTEAHRARGDDAALLLARYAGVLPGSRQHVSRVFVQRHDLRSVGNVREFLRHYAHSRGWDEITADLELIATEVVTNALMHADSEVDVRLREYSDRLRVEVLDSDPRPPMPAPITVSDSVQDSSEHGRGLVIVEALAAAWGNSPSGRGKSVWFELPLPGGTRPSAGV
ncbi:ATP-binding SpoIIE family protein phosphatase [Streptomyces cucumeris]|uniref:ATP-binding SpoIIE family protein phosphatase n=1 Tax=Streptomyces cucumeris TaxID=2962890 RepID=UPI003D705C5E